MAISSDFVGGGRNLPAFLDMLAWAEGTSTSKHTKDDGYDVVAGGMEAEGRAMAEIAQRSRAAGGACERTYDGVRQSVLK